MTATSAIRRALLVLAVGLTSLVGSQTVAAADDPSLSGGCNAFRNAEDNAIVVNGGSLVISGSWTAGEQVRLTPTTTSSPSVTVAGPDGQSQLPATSGEPTRFDIPTSGNYTFTGGASPAASVSWSLACGIPPIASLDPFVSGTAFDIGSQVRFYFGCASGTNPVSTCELNNRNFGLCSSFLGCDSYLDTATLGEHTLVVRATDTSGLQATRTVSYLVVKKTQTVTIDSAAPTGAVYRGRPYDVSASATSGLPATISVDPSSASVCAVSGARVSYVGVGTCVIHADQAGDGAWEPAPQATQSFVVGRESVAVFAHRVTKGVLGLTPSTFEASLSRDFSPMSGPIDPIPGESVTFSVAGKVVCSATTDADGIARCTAVIGLVNALTQSSYVASYAGSSVYKPSSSTGTLG